MRRFAISDIHGCARTFDALLDRIALSTLDELYLLGDYVDRGPDSRGVIDRIRQLQAGGYRVACLMGNHELMMIHAAMDPQWRQSWMQNGGWETLHSFGAAAPGEISGEYLLWAAELPAYLEVEDYLLVHAGFNFREADPLADTDSMLWIRDWYGDIDHDWLDGRIIIHGHTPIDQARIEFMYEYLEHTGVLDIDCGCVFNFRRAGVGYLCAFDMTNRRLFFHPNVEEPEANLLR